ncbi:MAG: hypothetical protein WKF60_10170 [Ilumatobacter sp.]
MSRETFDTLSELIGIPLVVVSMLALATVEITSLRGSPRRPNLSMSLQVALAVAAIAVIAIRFLRLA